MNKCVYLLWMILAWYSLDAQRPADSLLHFIRDNPSRASICLVQNDQVLAKLNENKLMPLASTVKIMVAIEFAKQAGSKVINGENYVALKELDRYYIPNTDGGAHTAWLAHEQRQKHIINDSARLIDIARGMIVFSSNANTEFLMDLLGFDNVKNNIQLLGLKQHTAIYPMVASLFIYQNPKNRSEESIIKGIKKLTHQEYSRFSYDMHNALKYNDILKSTFRPQDLSMPMQKLWSDRLPASTTHDYALIGKILNNRKYFDDQTYGILADVLETVMENPHNRQWLKHAGMKGGSTPWVLTRALYGTTKAGDRIEMAYFFNELNPTENNRLQQWMNDFELLTLSDTAFRNKVATILK